MSNIAEQSDEIAALSSIYEGQWTFDPVTLSYTMNIAPNVQLHITLNEDYPSSKPPTYELSAPHLPTCLKTLITNDLEEIYVQNIGRPIIYQWIERIKELLGGSLSSGSITPNTRTNSSSDESRNNISIMTPIVVYHGPTIEDRKSVFQGHCAHVTSIDEVREVKNSLLSNKKVEHAAHNILAYRIELPNGCISQDHDEDGENNAGGRLMHLLELMKLTNIVVVVTRWYGGIQLGPDRFRHINNAARRVLTEAGFIN